MSDIMGDLKAKLKQEIASFEPVYSRGRGRPAISTAAHTDLRELLKDPVNHDRYHLAEAAVNLQLSIHEKSVKYSKPVDYTMLKLDLNKLKYTSENATLGENMGQDVQIILDGCAKWTHIDLQSAIWMWYKLPYAVRCAGTIKAATLAAEESKKKKKNKRTKVTHEELLEDIDEWVLRNEMHLRSLSKSPTNNILPLLTSVTYGLIVVEHLPTVIPSATPVKHAGNTLALKITRPAMNALPGFSVLHEKRRPVLYIQPSVAAFRARFDSMTEGILSGLDWNNLFTAGGLVLGALLTPEIPSSVNSDASKEVNKPSEWISSDIDMYIYGLPIEKANEKIEHIAEVYQRNLPTGAPFLVVRNSQTITLYSQWPRRRVQIVLKLVKDPREVLLNFDLDICAVGWDGRQVWMLPRCARAIETGTNVFTMDLVNGHYLGDRKATRDKRVFKYANKGFGLRIIPSYSGYLSSAKFTSAEALKKIARGEKLLPTPLVLADLAKASRSWTRNIVEKYIEAGQKEVTFYLPRGKWPRVKGKNGKPVFSQAMLDSYAQITWEPLGRSCLTGFSLLMRHVALWEMEVEGVIEIYDHIFAEDAYNSYIGEVAYDDTPAYEWDQDFKIDGFKRSIDAFNDAETDAMRENISHVDDDHYQKARVSRVVYASSVKEALEPEKDVVILLILRRKFMRFANKMFAEGLERAGIERSKDEMPLREVLSTETEKQDLGEYAEIPVAWHLDKIVNWQMLDRKIDEVREVLWALHRANERMFTEDTSRDDLAMSNISRRAIRMSEEDEMQAFVRWVGRRPFHEDYKVNGLIDLRSRGGIDDVEDLDSMDLGSDDE